jgi:hypothetical protein
MSKVFISWYDGQNHKLANQLFGLLKKHGLEVECSPRSPHSGFYDEKWKKWYQEGLPKAITQAEIFIAVITPACDGSTWMLQEFQEAYASFLQNAKPKLYFIRFDSLEHQVKYPDYYLQNSIQLSSVPEQAVHTLLSSSV